VFVKVEVKLVGGMFGDIKIKINGKYEKNN